MSSISQYNVPITPSLSREESIPMEYRRFQLELTNDERSALLTTHQR